MSKSSRRDFLRNTALAGLLAPVVHYWDDLAEAQEMGDENNLILIFLPNGKTASNPFITGSGTSFSFEDGFRPYEAYKDRCIAISEYGFQAFINAEYTGDHGGHVAPGAAMFSGEVAFSEDGAGRASMAPTVDQIVAFDRQRKGLITDPLRASLNIKMTGSSFRIGTVFTQTPADYELGMTYSRALTPVSQHGQPQDGFDQIFGSLADMAGSSTAELWAFGKSTLDVPRAELQRIRPQLPREGTLILDEHLSALADLEASFMSDRDIVGEIPDPPGNMDTSPASHRDVWSQWVRMIDAAIRLGQTHIFTVQFGGVASRFKVPELGLGFVGETGDSNSGDDHHSYTHWDESRVPLFMNWYAERVSELLGALAGDGTAARPDVLAKSAVMVGMEFGRNHNARDVPVTIFGEAGGYLSTGRAITYGNEIEATHKHTGTLLGLAHAMGTTDLATLGNPKAQYQDGVADELRG